MTDEPFYLYKFRAINKWLIESLVNRSLYFARPDELNDPFDCRVNLQRVFERAHRSTGGARREFLFAFLKNAEFFENWNRTLSTLGVCCFSRTDAATLLWTHYADSHRGLCLKLQFAPAYLQTDEFSLTAAGNVEYRTEPLIEWLTNGPTELNKFSEGLVHRYLKTKSPHWEYEEEERIIRREHGIFRFDCQPFLKEVCFGLRTSRADIDLVINLAQKHSNCTVFSQMVCDETEFGFVKQRL